MENKKKKEPWRIIVFIIAVLFIVYRWIEKDVVAIYTTMPKEQVAPLIATTIAVSLLFASLFCCLSLPQAVRLNIIITTSSNASAFVIVFFMVFPPKNKIRRSFSQQKNSTPTRVPYISLERGSSTALQNDMNLYRLLAEKRVPPNRLFATHLRLRLYHSNFKTSIAFSFIFIEIRV